MLFEKLEYGEFRDFRRNRNKLSVWIDLEYHGARIR